MRDSVYSIPTTTALAIAIDASELDQLDEPCYFDAMRTAPTTASIQICDRIRDDIVAGLLPFGGRLTLDYLPNAIPSDICRCAKRCGNCRAKVWWC